MADQTSNELYEEIRAAKQDMLKRRQAEQDALDNEAKQGGPGFLTKLAVGLGAGYAGSQLGTDGGQIVRGLQEQGAKERETDRNRRIKAIEGYDSTLKGLVDLYKTRFLENRKEKDYDHGEKIQGMKDIASEKRLRAALEAKDSKQNQYAAATYGQRLEQAEQVFGDLAKQGYDPSGVGRSIEQTSLYPEALKRDSTKKQDQAERSFINAVLRRESGAAISPSEFDSGGKQYFPRIGDSQDVLVQKAKNRMIALAGLKAEAGPAWEKVQSQYAALPQPQQRVVPGTNGSTFGTPDANAAGVPVLSFEEFKRRKAAGQL